MIVVWKGTSVGPTWGILEAAIREAEAEALEALTPWWIR